MSHGNRDRATVHLDADWTPYTDAIPQGSIALGTITQGSETGALIYHLDTQNYFIITPTRRRLLIARKVKAAIQAAQSALDQPKDTSVIRS